MSTAHKLRINDQLCFALYAATNAITRMYRPLLAAIGVTYPQYLVLMVLWEHGTQTSGEIARTLELSPNAVTPLVDRLVAMQLVRRKVDTEDRRSFNIHLTARGAALEDQASQVQNKVACATDLTNAQFVALRKQLHTVALSLGAGTQ